METDRVLSEAFVAQHPAEAARAMEGHSVGEVAAFLSESVPEHVAPVVAAMDPTLAAAALGEIEDGVAAPVVEALPAAAAGRLLRRLPPKVRGAIVERMTPRNRRRMESSLRYPPGSAGALLDPAVLTVAPDLTVDTALARVRGADSGVHYYLFVVDRHGMLAGVVSLHELLAAPADALVGAIARRAVATLAATADRAAIVAHPSWQELHTLPVVDAAGRFLGRVRPETLRRLESEESATPLGTAATAGALDFGELAWTLGAAVIGELFDAVSPAASRTAHRQAGE